MCFYELPLSSASCSFYRHITFPSLLLQSTCRVSACKNPTPTRPFVYVAITIVDRYDVGITPQGDNTRGCNRFAEFPKENCDPQPRRLRRRVALVLVGLDTAKFHGGYRSSNFIVK